MSILAVLLGAGVAGAYGASDFLGGVATKRSPVQMVLVVSQATGLLLAAIAVAAAGQHMPSAAVIGRGALSGVLGVTGVAILYRGLARRPMVVVAPLAAVVGALVPVAWGLARGERPRPAALVGVAFALGAAALVSIRLGAKRAEPGRRWSAAALAAAAGACFGWIFVLLAGVPATAGLWPLLAWRVAALILVVPSLIVARPAVSLDRATATSGGGAGALETLGIALYLVAARHGLVALVGAVSSLYPAATVLLARVVLGERLSRLQLAGLAMAVVGIGLVGLG